MPERFSLASASLTSSTLLGRMMAFSSFISILQSALQGRCQRVLLRIGEFRAPLRDVKHVDRFRALGRDEHQIDLAATRRYRRADPVQQTELVSGNDFDDRVPVR